MHNLYVSICEWVYWSCASNISCYQLDSIKYTCIQLLFTSNTVSQALMFIVGCCQFSVLFILIINSSLLWEQSDFGYKLGKYVVMVTTLDPTYVRRDLRLKQFMGPMMALRNLSHNMCHYPYYWFWQLV